MNAKATKQMLVIIAVILELVAIGSWCIAMIEQDVLIFLLFGFIFVAAQSSVAAIAFGIASAD